MNIKIKGEDLEITNAIYEYAEKKIGEALEKFTGNVDEKNIFAEVELSKTNKSHSHGDMYRAEINLSGIHDHVYLEEIKDDLYAAIDGLKDKLEYKLYGVRGKKKTLSYKLAKKFKDLFKKGE